MADFLKQDVLTPLRARHLAAGVPLCIDTNSDIVLAAARENLESSVSGKEEIRLRLWIEEGQGCAERQPRPYFRGLGHLVFSGYGDRSSLVINLRDRCGAGRLTESLAMHAGFWRTVFFPSLIGILGPSLGLTPLHSACVAAEGAGLLLVGGSGAGKSSLSLALAQEGMDYLSDDRTLIGAEDGRLRAWGLSGDMKQRSDADSHFPELKGLECGDPWRGDDAFRFDPVRLFGIRRIPSCEPKWIVFLERQSKPRFSLEELSPAQANWRLQRELRMESAEAARRQRLTIETLSQNPCYVLRYGGSPFVIAGALRQFLLEGRRPTEARSVTADRIRVVPATAPPDDPLRRFRTTPVHTDVLVMGRRIHVETDDSMVFDHVTEALGRPGPGERGMAQFLWRIVSEPVRAQDASWPALTAFSAGTLRYISIGQNGFVAADLLANEAVAVLPEPHSADRVGFSTVVLAGLLHLTAPALGLTAISAACVAKGSRGLLLFGPPNSGKTTASYHASKLGLDVYADQATFLDVERGTVRAWGDFWPAAFRPETARFLPEISRLGRMFTHCGRTFVCMDKPGARTGSYVTPTACIFLERHAASPPRLVSLARGEMAERALTEAGSREDHEVAGRLLGRLPAYRLLYDDDPYIAALFFRSVLDAHELMEQRV